MELASIDGVVGPAAEAQIPVTDEGLLRGDGVFEVMRVYGGVPFALEDHLARMERSAANLRLPVDVATFRGEIAALLAARDGGAADGLVRLVATRGGRRIVLTEPAPDHGPSVRLASVVFAPPRILDGVKSLSYGGNMLATRIAKERGADEALLVTPHGRVLEAPTSSFFWAREGAIFTPPLEDHILDSITRRLVLEVADVTEAVCTLEDVGEASEAFIASTTREVQPVAAIDGAELPVAGPLTAGAAAALSARIRADIAT